MTREEAIEFGNMWLQINDDSKNSHTYAFFQIAMKSLKQEPRKGHWINKHHSDEDESCSAECSSCHKRSDGYAVEYGYGLKFMYHDFCPKCGSDNREVEK